MLGPDAALDALPDVWNAYDADVDAMERFVMQIISLTRYIESEGLGTIKALGKRFFIEETVFGELDVLDCWQQRMRAALFSESLAT